MSRPWRVDMQLGSKAMAVKLGKRLTQRFGGTIKETSTVVGANDGIEVTRDLDNEL